MSTLQRIWAITAATEQELCSSCHREAVLRLARGEHAAAIRYQNGQAVHHAAAWERLERLLNG